MRCWGHKRQVLIEDQLHLRRRQGSLNVFHGPERFFTPMAGVLLQELLKGLAGGEVVEHHGHRHARPRDKRGSRPLGTAFSARQGLPIGVTSEGHGCV